MDEIALENVLRRLGRTPVKGDGPPVVSPPMSSPMPSADLSRKGLQESMGRDFQALLRRAAQVYERLSPADRKAFLAAWSSFEERMDRAHQDGVWAEFQAALVEAKALLAEAQPENIPTPTQAHWVYRAWSRVLDAAVWFVCCEQEIADLVGKGVQRGAIYTRAELEELLNLPRKGRPETLRSIHKVKVYFDGTVVSGGADGNPGAS